MNAAYKGAKLGAQCG